MLFTWASRGKPLDYVYDTNSATAARDSLEHTLRLVLASDADQVNILAHSMGNWVTVEALRQMKISGDLNDRNKFGLILLAAPDIDIDVFKSQMRRFGKSAEAVLYRPFQGRQGAGALEIHRRRGDPGRRRPDTAELAALGATVIDLTDVKADDPTNHGKFAQLARSRRSCARSSRAAFRSIPARAGRARPTPGDALVTLLGAPVQLRPRPVETASIWPPRFWLMSSRRSYRRRPLRRFCWARCMAGLISVLVGRLNRIIDRAGSLTATPSKDPATGHPRMDILRLERRAKLINRAIEFAVISGIFTTLLVLIAFASAFLGVGHGSAPRSCSCLRWARLESGWSISGSRSGSASASSTFSFDHSNMQRVAEVAQRGLLKSLAEGRVGMDRSRDVFQPRAHLQRESEGRREFGDVCRRPGRRAADDCPRGRQRERSPLPDLCHRAAVGAKGK